MAVSVRVLVVVSVAVAAVVAVVVMIEVTVVQSGQEHMSTAPLFPGQMETRYRSADMSVRHVVVVSWRRGIVVLLRLFPGWSVHVRCLSLLRANGNAGRIGIGEFWRSET